MSLNTSESGMSVSISMPLDALMIMAGSRRNGAKPDVSERTVCEGGTDNTAVFPLTADSMDDVTFMDAGRVNPGRYVRFSRVRAISSASSFSYTQRVTSCPLSASRMASVVPHAPAPLTPIFSVIMGNYRANVMFCQKVCATVLADAVNRVVNEKA